jgi:hypothetical protein
MEKMFKKSLLALALTATAFGAAASKIEVGTIVTGTFTALTAGTPAAPTAAIVSSEGLTLASNRVAFDGANNTNPGESVALKFELGSEYPASSVFVVEVTGAEFNTSGTGAVTPSLAAIGGAPAMNALDVTGATKLIFNVPTGQNTGDQHYLTAALKNVTGDVTFTIYGNAPVIQGFDRKELKVLAPKAQHKISAVNTTSEKIDVAKDRLQFSNASSTDFSVTVARETVNVHTVEGYDDTAGKAGIKLTLANDFSSYDTDNDQKLDDEKVKFEKIGGTLALDKSGVITVTQQNNGTLAAQGVTVTVDSKNATVLAPAAFTGNVVSKYRLKSDTAKTASYSSDVAFGSWTLNGSVVQVPYLPFGDNTVAMLRLTNTSTKTGDLSVRYLLEGSVNEWKSLGVVGSIGPGVTNISNLVMDAIKADADVTKGKVAIELTTNVPTDNVDVTAIFKVISDADRGVVATK